MKGNRGKDGHLTGTLTQILDLGKFKAKAMVIGGSCSEEEKESLGGKFLGIDYDADTDDISLKISSKMKMKVKKNQRDPKVLDLDEEVFEELLAGEHTLSKRKLLGWQMAQYDPLGVGQPIMVGAKLLFRELCDPQHGLGWDDSLPPCSRRNG